MKKINLIALLTLLSFSAIQAQQDPQYTQYMYNMSIVNPAYAGSKDALSLGVLYRKQWVNIEGAPTTMSFFGHAPVGKNVGLGLSVLSDQIGPVNEQNIYGDFSYTLNLGDEHKLAFGLKAGTTIHKVDLFSQVYAYVPNPNDPAFAENTSNMFFNVGAGLFYYTDKYYIAASIPNFMKGKYLDFNGHQFGTEEKHFFITGGYVFTVNPNLKLKPFVMAKSAIKAPVSIDASLNALVNDKVEFGLTYRLEDSFGAMVNFSINKNLRIGYAYDHLMSDLKVTTTSSHEIILLYDVNFLRKVSSSARFF
jgi:type IX secretion system PorP/SprF family membrane protein